MVKIVVIFHSEQGHTKVIAQAVAQGAQITHSNVTLLEVDQQGEIPSNSWQTLAEADAIIFGSVTHMGAASWQFKKFMDASSKWWFKQTWKDKIAGGFTNSGQLNGDKLFTLLEFIIFAGQHGMIWVNAGTLIAPAKVETHQPDSASINRLGSYVGIMAQSTDADSSQTPPEGDIKTAQLYGKRIAEVTLQWRKK